MTDVYQFPVVEPHGRNGRANATSKRDAATSIRTDVVATTDRSGRTSVNRRRAARRPTVLHTDRDSGPPLLPDVFIEE